MIEVASFGILSPEEIRTYSQCNVVVAECFKGDAVVSGGPCDLHMGSFASYKCETCGKFQECPGHPGHIDLAEPMFNPTLFLHTKYILSCVCMKCARLKLGPGAPERAVRMSVEKIRKIVKNRRTCPHCSHVNPLIKARGPYIDCIDSAGAETPLPAYRVHEIFSRVPMEDILYMKLEYEPRWLLYTAFPVLDNPSRPNSINGHQVSVDKLSLRLCHILTANKALQKLETRADPAYLAATYMLQDQVNLFFTAAYVRQSLSFKKLTARSGGSKGGPADEGIPLHNRLKSKEGQLRSNMMGKRGNYCARSVITGDPNLDLDQLGVPRVIAENLTYKEAVNGMNLRSFAPRNIKRVHRQITHSQLAENGDGIRSWTETRVYDFRSRAGGCPPAFALQIGDTVERPMRDGDIISLNRQPTLHRLSLLAVRVKVNRDEGKTFRMNVNLTPPFNADFDGDK